jgi:hypothetical protein
MRGSVGGDHHRGDVRRGHPSRLRFDEAAGSSISRHPGERDRGEKGSRERTQGRGDVLTELEAAADVGDREDGFPSSKRRQLGVRRSPTTCTRFAGHQFDKGKLGDGEFQKGAVFTSMRVRFSARLLELLLLLPLPPPTTPTTLPRSRTRTSSPSSPPSRPSRMPYGAPRPRLPPRADLPSLRASPASSNTHTQRERERDGEMLGDKLAGPPTGEGRRPSEYGKGIEKERGKKRKREKEKKYKKEERKIDVYLFVIYNF